MASRVLPTTLFALALCLVSSGASADNKALLAVRAIKAFECATYASKANLPSEEQRLLSVGYEAGRDFLQAVEQGEVSEEELQVTVPVLFSESMAGPAPDFILGRVYESAREDTVIRLTFEDENGRSYYYGDDGPVQQRANHRYRSSFCDLFE